MCKSWRKEKCNHHFPELNRRQRTFANIKNAFSLPRVTVITMVLVFVVGLTYLMQTNVSATQGYQIKDLETQIRKLQKVNKKLNLDYIELQSMAHIVERAGQFDLVAIDNVKVINSLGLVVARK